MSLEIETPGNQIKRSTNTGVKSSKLKIHFYFRLILFLLRRAEKTELHTGSNAPASSSVQLSTSIRNWRSKGDVANPLNLAVLQKKKRCRSHDWHRSRLSKNPIFAVQAIARQREAPVRCNA